MNADCGVCAEKKKRRPTGGEFEFFLFGGADRDRTDDLLNAIRTAVVDPD